MASEPMRSLLLRVILDDNFLNLMRTNPQKAIEGYELTDDEKSALSRPNISIHELLQTRGVDNESFNNVHLTATCTTAACTTTVAYCVTTTSRSSAEADFPTPKLSESNLDLEAVKRAVDSIRISSGTERFEKILALVSQVTG